MLDISHFHSQFVRALKDIVHKMLKLQKFTRLMILAFEFN